MRQKEPNGHLAACDEIVREVAFNEQHQPPEKNRQGNKQCGAGEQRAPRLFHHGNAEQQGSQEQGGQAEKQRHHIFAPTGCHRPQAKLDLPHPRLHQQREKK
jgi:hypothetical protein